MEKIIIAAVSENGVIGKNGIMPWHSREDLQHFKRTTINFPVIMGRKTLESMGKPLKGRLNIILTRKDDYTLPEGEVKVCAGIKEAYKHCREKNYPKVFIIGGGEIYKQELNNVDKLIISWMKLKVDGDTYFPEIDNNIWEVTSGEDYNDFTLKIYEKRK